MNKQSIVVLTGLALMLAGAGQTCQAGVYFGAVMADNPAYYWTFDEASGTAWNYGSAAGGNLAQVLGAARTASTSTTGGVSLGTTSQFDGVNPGWFYTDNAAGSILQGPAMNSYAIEMWTRATAHTSGRYLFEVGLGNNPSVIYNFDPPAPTAMELFGPGGRTGAAGPTALTDGNWHHVVIGYKDNGASGDAHTFIIDGGAPATFTNVNNQQFRADNQHFIVGADITGSNRYGGNIDELAVYNLTALSQAQFDAKLAAIASHRTLASTATPGTMTAYSWQVLKDNPRFYWNFNESDPRGNATEVVRGQTNDQLVATNGARRKPGATGNLGNSAGFDTADFFLAANLADGEMPGAWAIEMWAKADGSLAGSRGDYLMNAGSNNPGLIYDYGVGGDNKIELFGAGRTAGGGPSMDDNNWHHVVATFYGNGTFGVADRVDFAIDGVLMPNVPRGGFSSGFALNAQLIVGAALTNGAGGFQGQIDEVAFYDLSGLSLAQVSARTQQIAGHYGLGSQPANTRLRYVDRNAISYAYDVGTPSVNYPDSTGRELVDGAVGSTTTDLSDRALWVGIDTTDPQITLDLGHAAVLDSIFIDYIGGTLAGIHAPDSVDIRFSLDGTTFGNLMTFTDFNNSAHSTVGANAFYNRRLVADVNDVLARYVRMNFANDGQWTFLSEVQFVESVPEPGTLTLLALGGLGLAWWRRRK